MGRLRVVRNGFVFLLALVAATLVSTTTSHAVLTNELPTVSDVEAAGNAGYVDLHLKHLSVAQVVRNEMAAYYPATDTLATGKSIRVTVGKNGKVCNIDKPRVNGFLVVQIIISGTQTPNSGQYRIPIDDVCDTTKFYGHTFPFPSGTLIPDSDAKMNKATIIVRFDGTTSLNDTIGQDLNYRIELAGTNRANGRLGLTGNTTADRFGLRSAYMGRISDANGNNKVKITVPFGYPCRLTSADLSNNAIRTVKVYDADAAFGDTYMWVTKDGNRLNLGDYDTTQNRLIESWDSANSRWKLRGSNNDYNQLVISQSAITKGSSYKLVLNNVGENFTINPHSNTVSVSIPTDSITSELECNYSLIPGISINSPSYSYVPDITVTANITKSGPVEVSDPHAWEVYAVRYQGAPTTTNLPDIVSNTTSACSAIPSGGSGCTLISRPDLSYSTFTTFGTPYTSGGPDAPGTRLCFFARILNPTDDFSDDTQWRYSDMVCAVSGVTPKLQVWGHDVLSGKGITTLSNSSSSATFGSWGEYALFSGQLNDGMASASGLVNGTPNPLQPSWPHHATASNSPGCGVGKVGCYGQQVYPSSLVEKAKTLANGSCVGNDVLLSNIDIGDKSNITGTHVICSTGTVTVDRNLTYAPISVGQALPQVIIVAKNIVIQDTVTQLDSWLIAGNGDENNGAVYTCDRWQSTSVKLTSNICNTALKINGPLIAPRVYFGRTFEDSTNKYKTAAETVNLRADTFVWASQGSSNIDAQTISIKELPPRY